MKNLSSYSIDRIFGQQFARASGDFNPLHVDPVRARRLQFGSTVVHGVCATLKALDTVLNEAANPMVLTALSARFDKPIRHGDVVEVRANNTGLGEARIELLVDASRVQIIDAVFAEPKTAAAALPGDILSASSDVERESTCRELVFDDAVALEGETRLTWDAELMDMLFPAVTKKLPRQQTALLLGLTRIVGMECPGMNSIFGRYTLEFSSTDADFAEDIRYRVTASDKRFSRVTMAISHTHGVGEIEAFFRAPPVQQASFAAIKPLIDPERCVGQRALVVGGSRGIGEMTAKLIAAGGGYPLVTYASGRDDAERVAKDITAGGGRCDIGHYDVLAGDEKIFAAFTGQALTHVYYFASPVIEKGDRPIWSEEMFHRYCDYYLSGLSNLLAPLMRSPDYRSRGVAVFIPSTIYLDEPRDGFAEYAAAKAAAETLGRQIQAKYAAWSCTAPRLPRMLTDQTSAVATEEPLRIAEVMLPYLGEPSR